MSIAVGISSGLDDTPAYRFSPVWSIHALGWRSIPPALLDILVGKKGATLASGGTILGTFPKVASMRPPEALTITLVGVINSVIVPVDWCL